MLKEKAAFRSISDLYSEIKLTIAWNVAMSNLYSKVVTMVIAIGGYATFLLPFL